MAKTIQVRVDDSLKDTADLLFESLGLDTSTAIRIFLSAAIQMGGIPFAVAHNSNHDDIILNAINRRKSGERFYSSDEFFGNMRVAVAEVANNADKQI